MCYNDDPYIRHFTVTLPHPFPMPTRPETTTDRVWLFDTHETPEREIYLLLQHVARGFVQELAVVLRPAGVTPEQYHVLRVLRDAGSGGLACSAVAERSVNGDPDVTRLLDRLERQGWVSRAREASDRRVVMARITDEGARLLDELEAPVTALHARQLEGLSARELPALRKVLQKLGGVRSP
jgi:DNA-binding MarR family transcriptional regulator